MENKEKIVLTGAYEGSYNKLRRIKSNKIGNKKINLNIIKLFFKKRNK